MKKFYKNKKKIFNFIGIFITLFSLPLIAKGGLVTNLVTTATGFVAHIFSYLIGILMMLAAKLADIMLQFNINNLGSNSNPVVNAGWGITRDLANLGFVLAIIIIGFATIVQFKQYGVKKLLPKLIGAAIIVNFSLAIVMPIIGFSNILTTFFLNPSSSSNTWEMSGAIAGALNPQKLILGGAADDGIPAVDPDAQGGIGLGTAFILGITNIVFSIVFTGLATIVFAALAFMLLARYVVLSFLLMLAPIIWLAWVIPQPNINNMFTEWWKNFLKWCFFAPAVSFFIYIALTAAEAMEKVKTLSSFDSSLGTILAQGINMIIISALLIAGLVTAQKMGIYGADGAIEVARWSRGKMGNAMKRSGQRMGSYAFRKKNKEGKSWGDKARGMANNQTSFLGKKVGSFIAGGATKMEEMGRKRSDDYGKKIKGWSKERKLAKLPGAFAPEKMELLKSLSKDGALNKTNVKKHITGKTKELFENYGEGKDFKDIEKSAGMNVGMVESLEKIENGDDTATTNEELKNATKDFYGKMSRGDLQNISLGDIFSEKSGFGFNKETLNRAGNEIAESIAKNNQSLVPNILPKLNGDQKEKFEKEYNKALENDSIWPNKKTQKNAQKIFHSTINNFESGGYAGQEETKEKKERAPQAKKKRKRKRRGLRPRRNERETKKRKRKKEGAG